MESATELDSTRTSHGGAVDPPSGANVPSPADVSTEARRERGGIPSVWGEVSRLLGIVTAVLIGLASAGPVLDMLYTIRPDLRPQGPPVVRGVSLSAPVLEERVVACNSGVLCNRVSYEIEFTGYQQDEVEIAWAAFDPVTLRRVDLQAPGAPVAGQDKVESIAIAESATDRINNVIDVPMPLLGACIFTRVSVYQVDVKTEGTVETLARTRLDSADSPPFHTHDPAVVCQSADDASPPP